MDNGKIIRWAREIETLKNLGMLTKGLPREFYKELNEEERKAVIMEYKRRQQIRDGKPFDETK